MTVVLCVIAGLFALIPVFGRLVDDISDTFPPPAQRKRRDGADRLPDYLKERPLGLQLDDSGFRHFMWLWAGIFAVLAGVSII